MTRGRRGRDWSGMWRSKWKLGLIEYNVVRDVDATGRTKTSIPFMIRAVA